MPNFKTNGSVVAQKDGNKHTDRQTDKQTNIEKYNIGLDVCPVEYGGRRLYVLMHWFALCIDSIQFKIGNFKANFN